MHRRNRLAMLASVETVKKTFVIARCERPLGSILLGSSRRDTILPR